MEGGDAGNAAYVQWCGKLAESYDSDLVWGMCQSHGNSQRHPAVTAAACAATVAC